MLPLVLHKRHEGDRLTELPEKPAEIATILVSALGYAFGHSRDAGSSQDQNE
jgi:hypothetical protein